MSPGHWEPCTCAEFSAAITAAGGYENLTVWSSCTDLAGQYGTPTIFTCWGERDGDPVAADGGPPENQRPCQMDHVRFVATGPRPVKEATDA